MKTRTVTFKYADDADTEAKTIASRILAAVNTAEGGAIVGEVTVGENEVYFELAANNLR
ncbi:MAG: hypothetical protein HN774_13150 [Bacteroidetes Order II. Incertae sedis bacterium]|jgi:hypothetical protein|nr:hypothetical protein [Bacteroidetes Order II. bacterium]